MEEHTLMIYAFCAVLMCNMSFFSGFASRVDLSLSDKARYEHGKAKLTELRSHTRYGPCWTAALESLEAGCRQLTEDVQHALTVKFLECFLRKTGRPMESCDDISQQECTRQMSSEVFNIYTEFFTHTQSICFYLQATEWQVTTEETIDRLTDSSVNVVQRLESAEDIQKELLHKQNDSMRIQQQLVERGTQLRQTLDESKIEVQVIRKTSIGQ